MTNLIIGVIILFVSLYISRSVSEKAVHKLSQEKKAALVDLFSGERKFSFIFLFIIVLFYLLNLSFAFLDNLIAIMLYIVLLLAYIIGKSYRTHAKLRKHDFPHHYLKSYLYATAIAFIGFLVFFALLLVLLK